MPEFNLGDAFKAFGQPLERANALQGFLQQQKGPGMFAGIKMTTETGPEGTTHKLDVDDNTLQAVMKEVMGLQQKNRAITEAFDQQLMAQQQQKQARLSSMNPLAEVLTTIASSMGQAKDMPGWVQGLAQASGKLNPTSRELEGELLQLGQERANVALKQEASADRLFGMAARISDVKEGREARLAQQKMHEENTAIYRQQIADQKTKELEEKQAKLHHEDVEMVMTAIQKSGGEMPRELKAALENNPKFSAIENAMFSGAAAAERFHRNQELADKKSAETFKQAAIQDREQAVIGFKRDARLAVEDSRARHQQALAILRQTPTNWKNAEMAIMSGESVKRAAWHEYRAALLEAESPPLGKTYKPEEIKKKQDEAKKKYDDIVSGIDKGLEAARTGLPKKEDQAKWSAFGDSLQYQMLQKDLGLGAPSAGDVGIPTGALTLPPAQADAYAKKLAGDSGKK